MTADQLEKSIDLTKFTGRFTHGYKFSEAHFAAQMHSAIVHMWQELSGEWKPEGLEDATRDLHVRRVTPRAAVLARRHAHDGEKSPREVTLVGKPHFVSGARDRLACR